MSSPGGAGRGSSGHQTFSNFGRGRPQPPPGEGTRLLAATGDGSSAGTGGAAGGGNFLVVPGAGAGAGAGVGSVNDPGVLSDSGGGGGGGYGALMGADDAAFAGRARSASYAGPRVGVPDYWQEDQEHEDGRVHTKDAFGAKTIGWFGGFALLVNNMSGPGVMQIPTIFQQGGWLPPTLCLFVVCVVATLSSTMLCEAMSSVPGNEHFEDRVELTTLAKFYFGRGWFYATLCLFILSLQAVNVASIVVSAQTMDLTLVAIFGKTFALEWAGPTPGFVAKDSAGTGDSPFKNSEYVISLGFMIVLTMAIPLGYVNLDDNIIVQKIACILFLLIMFEWLAWFFFRGVPLDFDNVPAVGDNLSAVLGTVVFNYAYVTTIPSWVNEKKPEVSVNKSMWSAAILSTLTFSVVGIAGAWAYKFGPGDDILSVINDDKSATGWLHVASQITVYAFPMVALLTGIPIFSIIVRYNLVENNICRKAWANVWSVLLPWVVAIPAYTGTGLNIVIVWTSLLVNGVINFIIPVLLYIKSRQARYRDETSGVVVRQLGHSHADHASGHEATITTDSPTVNLTSGPIRDEADLTRFAALPRWIKYKTAVILGWAIIGFFSVSIVISIILRVMLDIDKLEKVVPASK